MRFLSIIIAIASSIIASATPPEGYTLVWEDNFEGNMLNRNNWNVEINGTGCGNQELQYYVDNDTTVNVSEGSLEISALRSRYKHCDFISGRINTLGKVEFKYGIVEARICLPKTANGLWPAFWMMGSDIRSIGWPRCGETDILEMGHSNGIKANASEHLFNGALHWGESNDCHRQTVGDCTNPYSLQDGDFHIWRVEWTEDSIKMYVDDCPTPYLDESIDTTTDKFSYFHKPNFILINLAVGGMFPNILNPDGITALQGSNQATMKVDYVKVYQKTNSINLTYNHL